MKTRYRLRLDSPETFDEAKFANQTVSMIKQLRALGNPNVVGLKRAKEALQSLAANPSGSVIFEGEEPFTPVANAIASLAAMGIIAEPDGPLSTIKQAAFDAIELGQHELCKDILEVLLKHGDK